MYWEENHTPQNHGVFCQDDLFSQNDNRCINLSLLLDPCNENKILIDDDEFSVLRPPKISIMRN